MGVRRGDVSRSRSMVVWVFSICLAAVWFAAGANKLMDVQAFAESIERFRLTNSALGQMWIPWAAVYLPWLEMTLGLGLLLPQFRTAAAVGSLGLLFVFTAVIVSAWFRGLDVDCGCFGDRLKFGHIGWGVARNTALIGWGIALLILGWGHNSDKRAIGNTA